MCRVLRQAGMGVCDVCATARAMLKRPKNGARVCKECFFRCFEEEVHATIVSNCLFRRGERVAIAASGGKGVCPVTMLKGD